MGDILAQAAQVAQAADAPLRWWIVATVATRWDTGGGYVIGGPYLSWRTGRASATAIAEAETLIRDNGYAKADGWNLYSTCKPFDAATLRAVVAALEDAG